MIGLDANLLFINTTVIFICFKKPGFYHFNPLNMTAAHQYFSYRKNKSLIQCRTFLPGNRKDALMIRKKPN